MTRNILITGGNGFIGSNFLNHMVIKYPNVNFYNFDCNNYCASTKNTSDLHDKPNYFAIENKIENKEVLLGVLTTYKIDTIIHFASHNHISNNFYNSLLYTNNTLSTHILLDCARLHNKIKRFIYISTDEVYGENNDYLGEEQAFLSATNQYATSKISTEMLVNSYYNSYKLPIIIVRCCSIYGKNQYIEKIIPKFITQILNKQIITIEGNGNNVRYFLYIDDFIDALEIILKNGIIGNIYNISSNDKITIIDLAKKIFFLINKNNNIDDFIYYIQSKKENDKRYNVNDYKLTLLGWNKKYSFDDSLIKTIEWYKNMY